MDDSEKRISKLYRKLVTSNEVKAFLVFEKCDEEIKQKLKHKLSSNGSKQAKHILSKLQNI